MTWRGVCPKCLGYGFDVTWGSSDELYVNCSDPACGVLILDIPSELVDGIAVNKPEVEDH